MVVYDIKDRSIRLRQASGDQFEFTLVPTVDPPALRLSCPPCWSAGETPGDAEFRVYLARAAAQRIAREAGLIGS